MKKEYELVESWCAGLKRCREAELRVRHGQRRITVCWGWRTIFARKGSRRGPVEWRWRLCLSYRRHEYTQGMPCFNPSRISRRRSGPLHVVSALHMQYEVAVTISMLPGTFVPGKSGGAVLADIVPVTHRAYGAKTLWVMVN
jgi:hypothetical protein